MAVSHRSHRRRQALAGLGRGQGPVAGKVVLSLFVALALVLGGWLAWGGVRAHHQQAAVSEYVGSPTSVGGLRAQWKDVLRGIDFYDHVRVGDQTYSSLVSSLNGQALGSKPYAMVRQARDTEQRLEDLGKQVASLTGTVSTSQLDDLSYQIEQMGGVNGSYYQQARRAISDLAYLQALRYVGEDGRVYQLQLIKAHPELPAACQEWSRQALSLAGDHDTFDYTYYTRGYSAMLSGEKACLAALSPGQQLAFQTPSQARNHQYAHTLIR